MAGIAALTHVNITSLQLQWSIWRNTADGGYVGATTVAAGAGVATGAGVTIGAGVTAGAGVATETAGAGVTIGAGVGTAGAGAGTAGSGEKIM